jgi:hypothetical protein
MTLQTHSIKMELDCNHSADMCLLNGRTSRQTGREVRKLVCHRMDRPTQEGTAIPVRRTKLTALLQYWAYHTWRPVPYTRWWQTGRWRSWPSAFPPHDPWPSTWPEHPPVLTAGDIRIKGNGIRGCLNTRASSSMIMPTKTPASSMVRFPHHGFKKTQRDSRSPWHRGGQGRRSTGSYECLLCT